MKRKTKGETMNLQNAINHINSARNWLSGVAEGVVSTKYADDHFDAASRLINAAADEYAKLKEEIKRLETMLLQGDCDRCDGCKAVYECDDLQKVGGDGEKFCPHCVDEALDAMAEAARDEEYTDAEYRGCRR